MEGQGVYSPKEQYKQMFIEAVGKRSGSMVMWQVLDEIGFFQQPSQRKSSPERTGRSADPLPQCGKGCNGAVRGRTVCTMR